MSEDPRDDEDIVNDPGAAWGEDMEATPREPFSVHDQEDFARVYTEDEMISIRVGDLRALLDMTTSSLDFGSGFLDNEQVEILRKIAELIGLDPVTVTPSNFVEQYVCNVRGHLWKTRPYGPRCELCGKRDPNEVAR